MGYPIASSFLCPFAIITTLANLPITQPNLKRHSDEARNTDPPTVADSRGAKRELPIFQGHRVADLRERVHVHQSTEQAFPEHDRKDDVHVGQEVVERVGG